MHQARLAYYEGQLAAHRGNFRDALRLAQKYADLVASERDARALERHHELLGLISFLRGEYAQAAEHYRRADLADVYNRYHLALALEGAGRADEARGLFREIADRAFAMNGYELLRWDAKKRAG